MNECMACDIAAGRRPSPGGPIHRTRYWLVEHAVGALGLGTLIVKPERHVTNVGELTDDEARELGPLLRDATAVARRLVDADQVYNCLWSHAGRVPGHIHYVIQPVTREQVASFDAHGPHLQAAMFDRGAPPADDDIERVADHARAAFSSPASPRAAGG